MAGRVRAYLGMSLDGRIAGPDDDLAWLDGPWTRAVAAPTPVGPDDELTYAAFTADVGAYLMGRRTYDVVRGFEDWPFAGTRVVVATTRPLDDPPDGVTAASGSPAALAEAALAVADGRDVYADGGLLVCALLDAGLLDELTTTVLPTVRGSGVGLFDGLADPHDLDLVRLATTEQGFVQLTWIPRRYPTPGASNGT